MATIYKELKRGDTGQLDKNMRREYSAELAQRRLIKSLSAAGENPPLYKKERSDNMAALHEIARQYAEEIRDGIAWVIMENWPKLAR